jgi:hypothetical protein
VQKISRIHLTEKREICLIFVGNLRSHNLGEGLKDDIKTGFEERILQSVDWIQLPQDRV